MPNAVSAFARRAVDCLSMAGFVFIVAVMGLAVFMRYIMGAPLQWVEELLITIFIWCIMLGAVAAMRTRGHVSIDAVVLCFPAPLQRFTQVFDDLVVIAVTCLLGGLGLQLALGVKDKMTPILKISYQYIDLAIPVGCFLMAAYALGHLAHDLRALARPSQEGQA